MKLFLIRKYSLIKIKTDSNFSGLKKLKFS